MTMSGTTGTTNTVINDENLQVIVFFLILKFAKIQKVIDLYLIYI